MRKFCNPVYTNCSPATKKKQKREKLQDLPGEIPTSSPNQRHRYPLLRGTARGYSSLPGTRENKVEKLDQLVSSQDIRSSSKTTSIPVTSANSSVFLNFSQPSLVRFLFSCTFKFVFTVFWNHQYYLNKLFSYFFKKIPSPKHPLSPQNSDCQ